MSAEAREADALLQRAAEGLAGLFGADGASLMLVDHEGQLVLRAAVGLDERFARERRPVGEGIAGWVARHGEPLLLNGAVEDERFTGVDPSIRSALVAPLRHGDRVLGVVSVKLRSGAATFARGQLGDLTAVASDIAGALARAEARRAVAQELHDGLAQELTGLALALEGCQRAVERDPTGLPRQLGKAAREARECLVDLRRYMSALRLQDDGEGTLPLTVARVVDDVRRSTGLEVVLERTGTERPIPAPTQRALVRIAQESLHNVARHASSPRARVTLHFDEDDVVLAVSDEGRGFDVAEALAVAERSGRFGLLGMRERAQAAGGELVVRSGPARGTTVLARIPYDPERRRARPRSSGRVARLLGRA